MKAAPENYRSDLKDRAILFGWVAGLLLLISMLMIFTGPVQAYYLLRNVNSVFINNNDTRRLTAYIPQRQGKADPFGFWFSVLNSEDRMFVFSVFKDGILIPLGAVVSTDGSVKEIIPLSAHAVQAFDALPESVLQMYVGRIEKSSMEGKR
jgi:hypothetical protein